MTGEEEAMETMLENHIRHMAGPDLVDKHILTMSVSIVQQTGVSISIFSIERNRTGNTLGHSSVLLDIVLLDGPQCLRLINHNGLGKTL